MIKRIVLLLFLLCTVIVSVGYVIKFVLIDRPNIATDAIPVIEEDYNKTIKDSIIYNIVVIDSTITVNKIKYNERVQEIKTLNDSNSIKLFYELIEGE